VAPTAPPGATAPPGTAPGATPTGPPGAQPGAAPPPRDPTQPPPPGAAPAGSATPTQVILTVPGTPFQVAGGPYTVPLSLNNAQRLSTMTITVTYNPNVLRVRQVQEGTFMRQGGVTVSLTPRIDAQAGRVDIVVNRTGDKTGASGAGLLAVLLFDAVGPGSSSITATGTASAPEGSEVPLQFSPVTVTVR
jgi:hypothetical protein